MCGLSLQNGSEMCGLSLQNGLDALHVYIHVRLVSTEWFGYIWLSLRNVLDTCVACLCSMV